MKNNFLSNYISIINKSSGEGLPPPLPPNGLRPTPPCVRPLENERKNIAMSTLFFFS